MTEKVSASSIHLLSRYDTWLHTWESFGVALNMAQIGCRVWCSAFSREGLCFPFWNRLSDISCKLVLSGWCSNKQISQELNFSLLPLFIFLWKHTNRISRAITGSALVYKQAGSLSCKICALVLWTISWASFMPHLKNRFYWNWGEQGSEFYF